MDPDGRTVDEVRSGPTSAFHRRTRPSRGYDAAMAPIPITISDPYLSLRGRYLSEGSDEESDEEPDEESDEAWIKNVMNKVNSLQPMDHSKRQCTIFKVPEHIRQLDLAAYKPVIAFLGPFHHDSCGSPFMKYHKWHCVRHLLSHYREHASQLLNKCLLELKELDEKVRSCYSEEFSELSAQKMALIMLLDGCFIIYLMLNICPSKESWNKKERKKEKEIAKETQEEAVGKLKAKAIEEDEGKKRKECMIEMREGEVVFNIDKKDKKGKGIAKEIEEAEARKLEDEATEEDEGRKRRERVIEMREGEVVSNIEKDKKGKGIAKEIEEEEVGKLQGEAREGEVVLNIDEKDEQLEGPTVAGLFTLSLVVYDLLKLENQIPFFIIHLLFDHLKPCEDGLVDLALQLFKGIHPKESESFKKSKKKSPSEYHHLLHLFYSSRIPSEKLAESTSAPGCIPELMKCKWKKAEVDPSRGSPTSAPGEAAPSQGASTSAPTSTSASGCICELMKCKWKKAEVDPSQESPTSAPREAAPSQGASTSAPREAAPSQGASTSALTSTSASGCIPELMKCKWKKAEVDPSRESPTSAPKWIPSATELDRAGVKFVGKKSKDSFLNIKFQKRKMKLTPLLCLWKLCLMLRSWRMDIPPLQIYDYTRPLFRNLIAFEQCYFDTEMYITIYALFMGCIIDQAEDVRLLHLKGILQHKLSNNQEVADLFNKLGSQIHYVWEKNYLANQIAEVNRFYEVKRHKRLAALRRDYFRNPWATISVLAASFLLFLAVGQIVFSVLKYFHGGH